MFKMGRKRFLITLGVSAGVWFLTTLGQLFSTSYWPNGFSPLGSNCTLTGYPLAFCLPSYKSFTIVVIYLINVIFWFVVINLLMKLFKRPNK